MARMEVKGIAPSRLNPPLCMAEDTGWRTQEEGTSQSMPTEGHR
jgi:hypothetical protein